MSPSEDEPRGRLDTENLDAISQPVPDEELANATAEGLQEGHEKTMYSVTDGHQSVEDMGTGHFTQAKLSRSELEQRSLFHLQNEQVAASENREVAATNTSAPEALTDQQTEDVPLNAIRQKTLELD